MPFIQFRGGDVKVFLRCLSVIESLNKSNVVLLNFCSNKFVAYLLLNRSSKSGQRQLSCKKTKGREN